MIRIPPYFGCALALTAMARIGATEPLETTPSIGRTSGPPSAVQASTVRDTTTGDSEPNNVNEFGGRWSAPTVLFTPAGALPQWSIRPLVWSEYQREIRARDAFRPAVEVALGLGYGFTVQVGTQWVGGAAEVTDAHAPHLEARYQFFGARDGMGFSGGANARYKWVGFSGRSPELELGFSTQYRTQLFEAGAQAVIGREFANEESDAEARLFAVVHVHRLVSVGAAAQARFNLMPDELGNYDLRGGIVGNFTIDRYQVGLIVGASNYQIPETVSVSPWGQVFIAYRFN